MSGAVSSESPLVPGFRLDRYELLCPIAQGGMAAVWLARMEGKHGFQKVVAIKTILPVHAQVPQFRRMFLDEATIASRIEHNHVAQILDLGEREGTLYLVMEWVDGESVSQIDRAIQKSDQSMTLAAALRIAADACAGLHAAHELKDRDGHSLGVVHRDVSPQNILVSTQGVVKLIDFGIAKARDRLSDETSTGSLKGKIHYMAPEQALGRPLDRRTDVWSVAAVLYRLLAGRPVHDGENQIDTLQRLTTNQPVRPLPDHVPDSVARIVSQALAFDPDYRYDSCAELGRAIELAMSGENLHCSAHDLADLLRQHVGARLDGRRQTLEAALRAASARSALAPLHVDDPNAKVEQPQAGAPRWPAITQEGTLTSNSTSFDALPPRLFALRARARIALGVGAAALLAVALAVVRFTQSTEGSSKPLVATGTDHVPATSPVPSHADPSTTAPPPPPVATPAASATAASAPSSSAKRSALPPYSRPKPKPKAINDGF